MTRYLEIPDIVSEPVTLTVAAFAELVHRKDRTESWANLTQLPGKYGRAIHVTIDNNTLATRDDPVLTVHRMENGCEVASASVRVSEVFELAPSVREIVEAAAERERLANE